MTPRCQTTRFTYLPMILLALFALVLQGCGGGGDDGGGGTSNADPTGYYTNTGTASVDNGAGGTISINDLQAMVDGNRIMMMSTEKGLLYDGAITSINGNDFTADFIIYTDGDNPIAATASGTITTDSSITGTLNGSGVGSGIFTLRYAPTNDDVADISRIENVAGVNATWGAKIGGGAFAQEFIIDKAGAITHATPSLGGIFSSCELNGNITSIAGSSLYNVSVELTKCDGSIFNGIYTGLATSRTQSNPDDTLVFSAVDGRYSLNGDFQ